MLFNKLVLWCALFFSVLAAPAYGQNQSLSPQVGKKAPQIILQASLNGPGIADLTNNKLKGKVVVLEFWASWCAPCIGAFPHINELATKYKDKPVVFLSISIDKGTEPIDKIEQVLKTRPLQTVIGLDVVAGTTQKNYGVNNIPKTFLIDKNGNLDAISEPLELTEKALDNLLAGKPSGIASTTGASPNTIPATNPPDTYFSLSVSECNGNGGGGTKNWKTEMEATCLPAIDLLGWLYQTNTNEIVMDSIAAQKKWSLLARFPEVRNGSMPDILQSAVPGILGVTIAREKRLMPVYVATCANGPQTGAKGMLKRVEDVESNHMSAAKGLIAGTRISASQVINSIADHLDAIVVDRTNLTGKYDLNLSFDTGNPQSFIAAVSECGITLTASKEMIEVLVVREVKDGK